MATRFYLPSSGAAAISPAFASEWEASTGTRRAAVKTRISSAMVSTTSAVSGSNKDCGVLQYVYGPIGAQTITGTFKGQIRALESATSANARAQIIVRVIAADASTVRGTLYAGDLGTLIGNPTSEYSTGLTNRQFPSGGATAVSSVSAQNGDYLVIEVGTRFHTTATTRTSDLSFGDNSATDLAEDEVTTTANNPWIEFSFTIADAANSSTRDVPQTAHILTTLTRSIAQGARISTAAVTRDVPQSAAIAETSTRDVPQTGHIKVTSTRTVSQTGHILTELTRSVPQTGRISVAGLTRSVTQTGHVLVTSTRDVPETAHIIVPSLMTRDVPQDAHIKVTGLTRSVTQTVAILTELTRSISQTARISTASLTRTIPQSGVLSERLTRDIPQEAVISGILARDIPQSAHVLVAGSRDVDQDAHILVVNARTVAQSAHLAEVETRDVPQSGVISISGLTRDIPQTAAISVPTVDLVDTEGYLHLGEDVGVVLPRVHAGLIKSR